MSESLKEHQISSARKSKAGNIVISCSDEKAIKLVENAMKSTDFVHVKKMEKNLPKMTVLGAGEVESNEDFKQDVLRKNPSIKCLVDSDLKYSL